MKIKKREAEPELSFMGVRLKWQDENPVFRGPKRRIAKNKLVTVEPRHVFTRSGKRKMWVAAPSYHGPFDGLVEAIEGRSYSPERALVNLRTKLLKEFKKIGNALGYEIYG